MFNINNKTVFAHLEKSIFKLLIVTMLIALAGTINSVSAVTWYVSTDGDDLINGGTSWEDAFATIQQGINASSDWDTVLVADGIYTGDGNKNITLVANNIEVRSANGPNTCIIDLENDGKGFRLEFTPTTSVIDGFTVMNGRPASDLSYGVGISCWFCSSTISNCIIKNNSGVQWGAGIDIRGSTANPIIVNTIFQGNNSSYAGSAVSVYQTSATFINCTFTGNTSFLTVIEGPSTTSITNSIVWNNSPGTIKGPHINVQPEITYSVVEGGYDENIDSDPSFINTPSLWDRTTDVGTTTTIKVSDALLYSIDDVIEIDDDGVARTVTFVLDNTVTFTPAYIEPSSLGMLIENWGPGSTNLDEDFRLHVSSPCIDVGNNLVTGIPDQDIDSKPRFIDGNNDTVVIVDMGANEYGDIGECDFNEDLDVDGADLVYFINNPSGYTLAKFVEDFGREDCPTYFYIP